MPVIHGMRWMRLTSWICFFRIGSCLAAFWASRLACFAWNYRTESVGGLSFSRRSAQYRRAWQEGTHPGLELDLHIAGLLSVVHLVGREVLGWEEGLSVERAGYDVGSVLSAIDGMSRV